MGLFGRSFKKKVEDALDEIRGMDLGIRNLGADVRGKVITLEGEAPSREVANQVMEIVVDRVKPDNVVNTIRVDKPEPPPPEPPAEKEAVEVEPEHQRFHEVLEGDTLSALAKKYYGDASKYPKIFDANRDVLDNPDLIRVGQRLRIPE